MNCIDHKSICTYTPTHNAMTNSLNIRDLRHAGHKNRKVGATLLMAALSLTLCHGLWLELVLRILTYECSNVL
jgi:hypothetical protein